MATEGKSKETTPETQVTVSPEKGESKVVEGNDMPKVEAQATEINGEWKKEDVEEKKVEGDTGENLSSDSDVKEKVENGPLSDLRDYERRAFMEFRSKVEVAILSNKLFMENKDQRQEANKVSSVEGESKNNGEEMEKLVLQADEKESPVEGESKNNLQDKEKQVLQANEKEKLPVNERKEEEGKPANEEEKPRDSYDDSNNDEKNGGGPIEKTNEKIEEKDVEIDKDITLWGVPLLPSKGDARTDVILLKFMRAREFEVNDAFDMLGSTLQWRKENKIDSIMEEDFGTEYAQTAFMSGVDREGHPVCYNYYGILGDDEMYSRAFGTEESREKFLRWRIQLMEKEIQKLDFQPGGISSLLQINDLKNTPGPSRNDARNSAKQAVALLQDNYPEFVTRNILINVPFWYYAFNALLSPFLTQRTKSKFVITWPATARVSETLLKYIAGEELPVQYGGLKRDSDNEFSTQDVATEITFRAGGIENIEIPAPEAGVTLVWEVSVFGWEVNYKEEFIPDDEGSYAVIVRRGKKMGWQEEPVRNSFKNSEPGKVVLTIENWNLFKKKRGLYRYKTMNSSTTTS